MFHRISIKCLKTLIISRHLIHVPFLNCPTVIQSNMIQTLLSGSIGKCQDNSQLRIRVTLTGVKIRQVDLYKSALLKGLRKMVIDDVEEMKKIQINYFNLKKNVKTDLLPPHYYWAIQDTQKDIQNLQRLSYCDLEVSGLYFRRQYELGEIKMFLSEAKKLLNHPITSVIKQTSSSNYSRHRKLLQQMGVHAEIYDYSQLENYLMAARVLGQDKNGNKIYADECYQYLCSKVVCSCSSPSSPIASISFKGSQWALFKPKRIDNVPPQTIIASNQILSLYLD